jgi:hypothetical protein
MRTKTKNLSTFDQWNTDDLFERLGIVPVIHSQKLNEWINVSPQLPPKWKDSIEYYRMDLYFKHRGWNETELLGRFIVPFLSTVEWRTPHYDLFNDRPIKGTVKGYTVTGYIDGLVASGSYEPHAPYFFLHEYKKMRGTDADPLGQLLIAMLAARELNQDDKPMYGCYIIGRYWTFVLLEGDTYCQSQGYDASDEGEIQIIWSILYQTKLYVEERVQASLIKEQP